MKKAFRTYILAISFCMWCTHANSQNSVLVNFGSSTCVNSGAPAFALIKDPLSASPAIMANCNFTAQLNNFFGVFVAYNPKPVYNRLRIQKFGYWISACQALSTALHLFLYSQIIRTTMYPTTLNLTTMVIFGHSLLTMQPRVCVTSKNLT